MEGKGRRASAVLLESVVRLGWERGVLVGLGSSCLRVCLLTPACPRPGGRQRTRSWDTQGLAGRGNVGRSPALQGLGGPVGRTGAH